MPVKYHCPKCQKRFVDWGAEKLEFKCPDCEEQELIRVGSENDDSAKRPTLKRAKKKAAAKKKTAPKKKATAKKDAK